MHRKKWFAWFLVIVIIVLPMPALVKYLQTYVVRNAVVTAFLFEVRAPVDGIVKTLAAKAGTVPGDSPAIVLYNPRLPRAGIDSLKARHHATRNQLDLHQDQLSMLERRTTEYQNRLIHYRSLLETDLDHTAALLTARQAGERAGRHEAVQNLDRSRNMQDPYKLSQTELDRIEADFHDAEARLNATEAALEQTRHRRKMVGDNLFLSELSDSVLQTQAHMDSLFLEIMACTRRIKDSEIELATIDVLLEAAISDHDRLSTAAIHLPDTALVWDVAAAEGMELSRGDRILSYIDRSRLMLDVVIDDSTLEWIYQGQAARIRLFGSAEFLNGTVIRVMGSASDRQNDPLAAQVKTKSIRDGRVLVSIDVPHLYEDVTRYCGVGRTAYVEFEGIGLVRQYLGSFFR
jgi:multidrug resistance efflux pump